VDEQAKSHHTGPPYGDPQPTYGPEPTHGPQPLPEPVPPPQPGAAVPVPPPPPEAWASPVRIEPVTGTPYGLAILGAPATTSGAAVGSLVSGIASVLVAMVVTCFGLAGAVDGWGLWVAGAFALLAGALGIAGVALGVVGLRQTRGRQAQRPPGYTHAAGQQGSTYGYPPAPAAPAPPGGAGGNPMTPRGRGMAVAGIVCGGAGLLITVCVLGLVTLVQVI
jgi:hypothetical protein